MPAPLLTFGHGRLSPEELGALVAGAGIEQVVDVRRFPGSRANEAAARGAVPAILERSDIAYRWEERLGGRRHLRRDEPSPDTWWRVEAFRAYAAWTRTPDFATGLLTLLADVGERRTAIMCSEAVWWRCHRRIVSDVVMLLHGIEVEHVMHTGALLPHRPSEGARVVDGQLVWDREAP